MERKAFDRLELFVSYYKALKKAFVWQNPTMMRLAALFCASEGKSADIEAIRKCYDIVKGSAGAFSFFRGKFLIPVSTLLSMSEEPERLLNNAMEVYDDMKIEGFYASDYLVFAAFHIAAAAPREKHAEIIGRARAFYKGMKKSHRFITGQDDYIFSVMLALSDIDMEKGLESIERLFNAFKPEFHSGMGVQSLAQVLVLGGDSPAAQMRVIELRDGLKRAKLRMDGAYTLSMLGVLALIPLDIREIVIRLQQTVAALGAKKGFGPWSLGKQELLLLSAALFAVDALDGITGQVLDGAVSMSITNIVIAQQAAIAAAVSASTAAAISSSSSN